MIVTEFREKLKVVSSDFSMMKNIVAPWSWFSSFPIKLICCGSFNLGCLPNQLQLICNFFFK